MHALMDWILSTPPSHFVNDTAWAWPLAETLHFIGLILMAGTVGVFDLRVLGVAKGLSPASLHRSLRWGIVGFAISVLTGLLFIAGAPDQYFYNAAFHFKALSLLAMGVNVALFYRLQYAQVRALGPQDDAAPGAKLMAGVSLALLAAIMLFGRMLTFFRPPGYYF